MLLPSYQQAVVRQNMTLALASMAFATLPTVAGAFPLWLAVLLHEGSTLMVALNSLRLLLDPDRAEQGFGAVVGDVWAGLKELAKGDGGHGHHHHGHGHGGCCSHGRAHGHHGHAHSHSHGSVEGRHDDHDQEDDHHHEDEHVNGHGRTAVAVGGSLVSNGHNGQEHHDQEHHGHDHDQEQGREDQGAAGRRQDGEEAEVVHVGSMGSQGGMSRAGSGGGSGSDAGSPPASPSLLWGRDSSGSTASSGTSSSSGMSRAGSSSGGGSSMGQEGTHRGPQPPRAVGGEAWGAGAGAVSHRGPAGARGAHGARGAASAALGCDWCSGGCGPGGCLGLGVGMGGLGLGHGVGGCGLACGGLGCGVPRRRAVRGMGRVAPVVRAAAVETEERE